MTGSRELQFPLHTDTQVHTHKYTHTYAQAQAHRCTHTSTHTQTQVHAHICTIVHTHAQAQTHVHIYESAHTQTHTQVHAHTSMHTHTHQHAHRCSPSQGSQGILRMPLSPSRSHFLNSCSSTRLPTPREPGRWSLSISRCAFHSAGSWAWQPGTGTPMLGGVWQPRAASADGTFLECTLCFSIAGSRPS